MEAFTRKVFRSINLVALAVGAYLVAGTVNNLVAAAIDPGDRPGRDTTSSTIREGPRPVASAPPTCNPFLAGCRRSSPGRPIRRLPGR